MPQPRYTKDTERRLVDRERRIKVNKGDRASSFSPKGAADRAGAVTRTPGGRPAGTGTNGRATGAFIRPRPGGGNGARTAGGKANPGRRSPTAKPTSKVVSKTTGKTTGKKPTSGKTTATRPTSGKKPTSGKPAVKNPKGR